MPNTMPRLKMNRRILRDLREALRHAVELLPADLHAEFATSGARADGCHVDEDAKNKAKYFVNSWIAKPLERAIRAIEGEAGRG